MRGEGWGVWKPPSGLACPIYDPRTLPRVDFTTCREAFSRDAPGRALVVGAKNRFLPRPVGWGGIVCVLSSMWV